MCKAKFNGGFCTELGRDPSIWSKTAPLSKPAWMRQSLSHFQQALKHQSQNDRTAALREMSQIDDSKLRTWFVVHAQNIGKIRFDGLGAISMPSSPISLDPNKSISKFTKSIYEKDQFTCVYCDWPVFPKRTFTDLADFLKSESFVMGRTNATRPGVYLTFCATLDHLVPHNRGGRTDETNLVTACWPCNYGKSEYLLNEIGLDPIQIEWAITDKSLEILAHSKPWLDSSLGKTLTPQSIYGSNGRLGHFASKIWTSPSEMQSELMQNMGGGVPVSVIDFLVAYSRVLTPR